MRKLVLSLFSTLSYIFVPSLAYAQAIKPNVDPCTGAAAGIARTLCDIGTNPANTIRNIVVFFVILAVVIALLYLVYGGIKWITSRGEKDQVEAARNHVIAAIVGLIVVFLAIFLLSIVLAAFGIKFEQLQIPNIGTVTGQ